jgi:hypothetical protein
MKPETTFNEYYNPRNIWAEGTRICNVFGLLCNAFCKMDWIHNCTKHPNFNCCYVTMVCMLSDHQTPMPKYVTNQNKSAVIKVNLHTQQGYVDRKINIAYSSKYVETKEEYEQINTPNILTVCYHVLFIQSHKSKPYIYIYIYRFYAETLNCLGRIRLIIDN